MIVGATIAVTEHGSSISDVASDIDALTGFKVHLKLKEINGIKFYALSMGFSSFSYVLVSLITFKEKVNMDEL